MNSDSSVWLPFLIVLLSVVILFMCLSKTFLESKFTWYDKLLKSNMNLNLIAILCIWIIMMVLLSVVWSINNYYISETQFENYNLYVQTNYILAIIMLFTFFIPVIFFGLKNFFLSCSLTLIAFFLTVFYIYLINNTVVNYCCQIMGIIFALWLVYITYNIYFISHNNFVIPERNNLLKAFVQAE